MRCVGAQCCSRCSFGGGISTSLSRFASTGNGTSWSWPPFLDVEVIACTQSVYMSAYKCAMFATFCSLTCAHATIAELYFLRRLSIAVQSPFGFTIDSRRPVVVEVRWPALLYTVVSGVAETN